MQLGILLREEENLEGNGIHLGDPPRQERVFGRRAHYRKTLRLL